MPNKIIKRYVSLILLLSVCQFLPIFLGWFTLHVNLARLWFTFVWLNPSLNVAVNVSVDGINIRSQLTLTKADYLHYVGGRHPVS